MFFVSSNGFDVAGAKHYGFQVAWIQRTLGKPEPGRSDVGPAEFCQLMRGYAEHLEQMADYRVARLTDLAPLIERLSD